MATKKNIVEATFDLTLSDALRTIAQLKRFMNGDESVERPTFESVLAATLVVRKNVAQLQGLLDEIAEPMLSDLNAFVATHGSSVDALSVTVGNSSITLSKKTSTTFDHSATALDDIDWDDPLVDGLMTLETKRKVNWAEVKKKYMEVANGSVPDTAGLLKSCSLTTSTGMSIGKVVDVK